MQLMGYDRVIYDPMTWLPTRNRPTVNEADGRSLGTMVICDFNLLFHDCLNRTSHKAEHHTTAKMLKSAEHAGKKVSVCTICQEVLNHDRILSAWNQYKLREYDTYTTLK